MSNKKTVSIIIPAYNEEKRIKDTIISIQEYLLENRDMWADPEVIVVSDGSTDGTDDLIKAMKQDVCSALRLISYKENEGKGYAIKMGVLGSRGDIVLFADADGATPINELNKLAAPILSDDADMVIASRRAPGSNIIKKQPPHRKLLGNCFSFAVRTMLDIPFLDTQCGFKVFRGEIAREVFKNSECAGFAIDIEILWMFIQRECRIKEIGVKWIDGEDSKVNALKDGVKMLFYTMRLSMKRDWKKEFITRFISVKNEVVTTLKQIAHPKNWWVFLPIFMAIAAVYIGKAYDIKWLIEKGDEETTALCLIGSAAFVLFLASLKFRNMAVVFLCVLAANFLIRELDQTQIPLPGGGSFAMRTKLYIYIALGVLALWAFWKEKNILPFFDRFPAVRVMMVGIIATYVFSQLVARRVFKHIPILPNEHQIHIPLEEVTENFAHLFFLILGFFVLLLAFKSGKTDSLDQG